MIRHSMNSSSTTKQFPSELVVTNQYLADEFFLQTHPFSDCILVLQDKKLHVDKSVLSAVSKVFQAYFQEKNINSMEIIDITTNEMILLLRYLYPQFQCTINYHTVTTLLLLAHRFEIDFIIDACRSFILLYLSTFNSISSATYEGDLIEQNNGLRLPISSILDSLCVWLRIFSSLHDATTCQAILDKISRCHSSNLNMSKVFNELKTDIQSEIFQSRAQYLEKSFRHTISDIK